MPVVEGLECRMLLSTSTRKFLSPHESMKPPSPVAIQTAPVTEGALSKAAETVARLKAILKSHGPVQTAARTVQPPPVPVVTLQFSTGPKGNTETRTYSSSPAPASAVPNPDPDSTAPPSEPETQLQKDSELSPQGMSKLPSLPWSPVIVVSGILKPNQAWQTYRIPIGPTTQELKVTVNEANDSASPEFPALDELYLVGPGGNVLATVTGASAETVGPQQDLLISLRAVPRGAQLLVRIVENALPAGPSLDPQAPTQTVLPLLISEVPFTMEVMRAEQSAPSAGLPVVSPPGTGGPMSTLPGVSNATGTVSGAPFSGRSLGRTSFDPARAVEPAGIALSLATAMRLEEAEPFIPGAYAGPLVLRGSAPLGPSLGTTQEDPVPAVDRSEPDFDLASDASSAGSDILLLPGWAATVRDDGPGQLTDADKGHSRPSMTSVPLRGPGGYPILVAALSGAPQRPDPLDLLATLDPKPERGNNEEAGAEDPTLSLLESLKRDRLRRQEATCADFITAACGLALGIGVTTGPLYPDLMTLVRTCLPGGRTESLLCLPLEATRSLGSSLWKRLRRRR